MIIHLFASGQKLTMDDPYIVANTIDYLEAEVHFTTADWHKRFVWAVLENGEEKYRFDLKDGKISKEQHLNLSEGPWSLSVFGTAEDGSRITTNPVEFTVKSSGPLDGEPLGPIPFSVAEVLDQRTTKALQLSETTAEAANAAVDSSKLAVETAQKTLTTAQELVEFAKNFATDFQAVANTLKEVKKIAYENRRLIAAYAYGETTPPADVSAALDREFEQHWADIPDQQEGANQ